MVLLKNGLTLKTHLTMFIGHFGLGMGAKVLKPGISLGLLFTAAQFVDLLWPTFLLLNLERVRISPGITKVNPLDFVHYPFSHSLLMAVVWGVLLAGVYRLFRKDSGGALLLGLLVVSHWLLDLIVHRPDLPLLPAGGAYVGLGLWDSVVGTLLAEGLLFVGGFWMYLTKTTARNRAGSYGLWALILLLAVIQGGNMAGPPPANTNDIAWGAQLQWLLVLLAFWVDSNRAVKPIAGVRPGVQKVKH